MLDEIANVEVGAQDKPLEDVVIETVEVADRWWRQAWCYHRHPSLTVPCSLENGTTGSFISEIKTGYIDNIYTVKVDQEVLIQVVDFDEFTQKASLL